MSAPSVPELEAAAKELVFKARAEGVLSKKTPRMIRQELEAQFGLEEGTLDESEYKKALKRAIKEAVHEGDEKEAPADATEDLTAPEYEARPESTTSPPWSPVTKRTYNGATKVDDAEEEGKKAEVVPSPQKRDKGKAKAVVKDEDEKEEAGKVMEMEVDEGEEAVSSKKRILSKPRSVRNIESDEEMEGGKEEVNATPVKKRKTSAKTAVNAEDPEVEDEPTPKKKRKTSTSTMAKPKPKSKKRKVESESEDEPEDEDEDEEESDYQDDSKEDKRKKRKSSASSKPKPKPKKKVISDEDDQMELDEKEEKEKEKRATSKSSAQKASSSSSKPKPKEKAKDNKKYKSLEHVPTSDMEQDEPGPIIVGPPVLTSVKSEVKKSASPSKSKSTSKTKVATTPRPQKSVSAKPSSSGPSKAANGKAKEEVEKSESETSVLVDEPPKKKRRSSGGEKKVTKPKEKKGAKASTSLGKDEETIKRLKALVVACGTRRVWSKVFQGLDTPQQQIKKLKEILTELGMTGRYSMEQAKVIKEKRELEQELQDVREFERKIVGQSSRTRSDAPRKSLKDISSDSESGKEGEGSGSEEEEDAPKKRAPTARKSIMAFLEDQSDEE